LASCEEWDVAATDSRYRNPPLSAQSALIGVLFSARRQTALRALFGVRYKRAVGSTHAGVGLPLLWNGNAENVMRYLLVALIGLIATGNALQAQQAAPAKSRLDVHLAGWEKAMSEVYTLRVRCIRTEDDKVFSGKKIFEGEARYMKPNLFSLEMRAHNAQGYEKYVCSGTFFYEYVPQQKTIRAHEIPRGGNPGQVGDDNLFSLIFGKSAADAKQRYDLSMDPRLPEDKNYIYINVLPRSPEDICRGNSGSNNQTLTRLHGTSRRSTTARI
jgi:hypothetical protein